MGRLYPVVTLCHLLFPGPILHLPGFYLFRPPVTAGLSSFASTAPVFLGPASSGYAYSPCAQVPGAPVSTSSGCTLASGSPLPTPRVLPLFLNPNHQLPLKEKGPMTWKNWHSVIVRCQDSCALTQGSAIWWRSSQIPYLHSSDTRSNP